MAMWLLLVVGGATSGGLSLVKGDLFRAWRGKMDSDLLL